MSFILSRTNWAFCGVWRPGRRSVTKYKSWKVFPSATIRLFPSLQPPAHRWQHARGTSSSHRGPVTHRADKRFLSSPIRVATTCGTETVAMTPPHPPALSSAPLPMRPQTQMSPRGDLQSEVFKLQTAQTSLATSPRAGPASWKWWLSKENTDQKVTKRIQLWEVTMKWHWNEAVAAALCMIRLRLFCGTKESCLKENVCVSLI